MINNTTEEKDAEEAKTEAEEAKTDAEKVAEILLILTKNQDEDDTNLIDIPNILNKDSLVYFEETEQIFKTRHSELSSKLINGTPNNESVSTSDWKKNWLTDKINNIINHKSTTIEKQPLKKIYRINDNSLLIKNNDNLTDSTQSDSSVTESDNLTLDDLTRLLRLQLQKQVDKKYPPAIELDEILKLPDREGLNKNTILFIYARDMKTIDTILKKGLEKGKIATFNRGLTMLKSDKEDNMTVLRWANEKKRKEEEEKYRIEARREERREARRGNVQLKYNI